MKPTRARPSGSRTDIESRSLNVRATTTGLLPSQLRGFIDRVIVPALVDRFLGCRAEEDTQVCVADCTPGAVVSEVVSSAER